MAAHGGIDNPVSFTDRYWWSNDGLRLHARDYRGAPDAVPVLCLPGLTRNARDYEQLAERLSPQRRVIAVDLRGRGDSAYAKDPMTYVPLAYVQDIERMLTELAVTRFVVIGTSLGGIVAMLLAATGPERIAAAVLNDIGPTVEPAGLERIRAMVVRTGAWPTWLHAARALGELNAGIYPDYALGDWLAMAKRLFKLTPNGRIVPDYDKQIAEPLRLRGGEAGVDLWPALDALTSTPTLILRGELSDVLSAQTVDAMVARLGDAAAVTVARTGHAPTLGEPEAVAAIDTLLARV